VARAVGWLSAREERDEYVRMISDRMARDALGKHEVDLVCSSAFAREPGLAAQVLATGVLRPSRMAHTAAMACLGDGASHEKTLRALTADRESDVEVAQVYLRHRPLTDASQLRLVTEAIGRMPPSGAQLRALETLARQRLSDPTSVQEVARLFLQARSLEMQRAIANILIRADHQGLPRADLARVLRSHRLKSPDGTDVIDALIQRLQGA
jgi:hypothetical protein